MLQKSKIKHRVSLHHLPPPQTQISFVSLSTQEVDPSSLHHLDSSLPPPLSWAWLMGGTNRRSEGGKTEVGVCLIELPPYLLRYPNSGAAVFSSAAGPFRQPFSISCCSMNHGPSSCCSDLGVVSFALVGAPGCSALPCEFPQPAHTLVNSPFIKLSSESHLSVPLLSAGTSANTDTQRPPRSVEI